MEATRNTQETHQRCRCPLTSLHYLVLLRVVLVISLTPTTWCGVLPPPRLAIRGGAGQARGWEGCTPAGPPQLSRKMHSDLRKQLRFLQRLQKPTPCLPPHLFAAEGETAGNRSFPDVTGMRPTVLSRRHRGVGSGRAGWEVMQLWTEALGSLPREVR